MKILPCTLDSIASLFMCLLGYGMSGDLRSLVSTWPELREEPMKMEGVLDLLHVHQEVLLLLTIDDWID